MANAPLEYASAGGQGGVLTKRSDMVLERKAIKGGYNLSPEQRQDIVARAHEILMAAPEEITDRDGNTVGVSYRDQLGAAKVLLAADKMDLDAEHMARADKSGTVNNTQINIFNASQTEDALAKLTDDELDQRIRANRDGAGAGKAEAQESQNQSR